MLQSDDDRWPYWDQEFEGDDVEEQGDAATEQRDEKHVEYVADKNKAIGKKKQENTPDSSSDDLMRFVSLGTELVAAVLIGTFLGWAFNRITGYKGPWALVVGIVIGSIAGFLNMYRIITEEEQKEEQRKRGSSK